MPATSLIRPSLKGTQSFQQRYDLLVDDRLLVDDQAFFEREVIDGGRSTRSRPGLRSHYIGDESDQSFFKGLFVVLMILLRRVHDQVGHRVNPRYLPSPYRVRRDQQHPFLDAVIQAGI